jgi:type VI secretion system protein VasD
MRSLLIRSASIALLVTLASLITACKSKPPQLKPPQISMSITVSADSNPDPAGRPAPVVVRIYQLKDDAAFAATEFFPLYDGEKVTLGPALLERREFELMPGEQRSFDYPISPDARFVGGVAAFRNIRNAQWRAIIPAPKQVPQKTVKKLQLSVAVAHLAITLSSSN